MIHSKPTPPCPNECGLETNVEVTLPDGWQHQPQWAVDYFTSVKCTGCGAVLKPAGTRRSDIPGFDWQT